MTRRILHSPLLPLLLLLLAATGCQTLYVPNLPQVPLMSQGDETQVSLSAATNGYGLQLGYSPYYHWALIANGNTFSIVQDSAFEEKYRHNYGEIGTGYYTCFNKYVRMEVLMGVGSGSSGMLDDRSVYRRAFLQPSFGVSGPVFDGAVTTRFSYVQHHQDKIGGVKIPASGQGLFLEPILTARVGYENIKFQFQGGLALPLGKADFSYRSPFFGIGLHLTFVKDFSKYEE